MEGFLYFMVNSYFITDALESTKEYIIWNLFISYNCSNIIQLNSEEIAFNFVAQKIF